MDSVLDVVPRLLLWVGDGFLQTAMDTLRSFLKTIKGFHDRVVLVLVLVVVVVVVVAAAVVVVVVGGGRGSLASNDANLLHKYLQSKSPSVAG